jgi:hypothetical protein
MVERGAHVVFGEGVWSRPPTVKAVTPLSGRPDELVSLAEHGLDHVDAAEVQKRATRQREAYYGGYRGVLGMAYLCLVAV